MGVGFQNANFNDIVTSAFRNHKSKFQEVIMDNNLLYGMLGEKGFIREEDGGYEIIEPLMFNVSTAVGSFAPYDVLDTSPQDTLTAAKFDWKYVHVPVSIDGPTKFKNGGKSRIIDLVAAKIKQAELSIDYYMDVVLFGDGTNNGSKDVTGLGLAVEEGTAWSTYGDIDSNAYTQWRNQWTGAVGSFATNGLDKMRSIYNSCTSGSKKPDLIVTTQAIFEYYEKTVTNIYRSMDLKKADLGYLNLMFKETPMIFDDNVPSGYMYFLNSEFIRLVFGKGKNMTLTPFQRPENMDAEIASMFMYLQMTCNHRRRQGLLTAITA